MRAAPWLIVACVVTMTCAITWAFVTGDFWREGAILMRLPWGVMSVIDVYTGGTLFAGWIAARERSVARTESSESRATLPRAKFPWRGLDSPSSSGE